MILMVSRDQAHPVEHSGRDHLPVASDERVRARHPSWSHATGVAKSILGHDVALIALGALALLVLVEWGPAPPPMQLVRVVLGVGFVLYVPGYCLTTALFPRRRDLQGVERTVFSVGASIAAVSLLALVLDGVGLGLRVWPILLSEYALMTLLIGVTLWRRRSLPPDVAYTGRLVWPHFERLLPASNGRGRLAMTGLLLTAGFIALALLSPRAERFTEFYVLGQEGLAESYPYDVAVGSQVPVVVGIANEEGQERAYRVEVWVADTNGDGGRRTRVLASDQFLLAAGESLEQVMSWRMPWSGADQRVDLLLFKNSSETPHGQLTMWINVHGAAAVDP